MRGGKRPSGHWSVVRSTVLPGPVTGVVIPTIKSRRANATTRVSASASIRSSFAKAPPCQDHYHPPFNPGCHCNVRDARTAAACIKKVDAEIISQPSNSRMVKYVCNAFHARQNHLRNERHPRTDSRGRQHAIDGTSFAATPTQISPRYLKTPALRSEVGLPKDVSRTALTRSRGRRRASTHDSDSREQSRSS